MSDIGVFILRDLGKTMSCEQIFQSVFTLPDDRIRTPTDTVSGSDESAIMVALQPILYNACQDVRTIQGRAPTSATSTAGSRASRIP